MDNTSPNLTITVPSEDLNKIPNGCARQAPADVVKAAVAAVPGIIRATTVTNSADMQGNPNLLVVVFRHNGTPWEDLLPMVTAAIRQTWTPAPKVEDTTNGGVGDTTEEGYYFDANATAMLFGRPAS